MNDNFGAGIMVAGLLSIAILALGFDPTGRRRSYHALRRRLRRLGRPRPDVRIVPTINQRSHLT